MTFRLWRWDNSYLLAVAGQWIDDASATLAPLLAQVDGPLVIDCYELDRINSLGIMNWIRTIGSPQFPTRALSRCSPATMMPINEVYNFAQDSQIESLTLPLFCEVCDCEYLEVIRTPQCRATAISVVQGHGRRCAACGTELIFDDVVERYFCFLQ